MPDKKVSFSGVSYRVIGVLGKSFVEPQIRQTGRDVGMWFRGITILIHGRKSYGVISVAL
ncbi:MAG: hypothetical protein ACI936_000256 [Paraglaciecola sp.]|jgi:hypothetical protein